MPLELQGNQPLDVVLAIFYRKNLSGSHEFFLQQRVKSTNRRLWEFPGGKVEFGETKQQALIREMSEELNIDLTQFDSDKIKQFEKFNYSYPGLNVQLHSFLIPHDFANDENGEWFYLDEINNAQFPLIEGSRSIIDSLKKYFCE